MDPSQNIDLREINEENKVHFLALNSLMMLTAIKDENEYCIDRCSSLGGGNLGEETVDCLGKQKLEDRKGLSFSAFC